MMKHSKFKIGMEFMTGSGRWRCTDVGTRTIAAIRLDLDHDPSWYNGPPYAVAESVFDEYAMEDCDPLRGGASSMTAANPDWLQSRRRPAPLRSRNKPSNRSQRQALSAIRTLRAASCQH
jgi:hypothetical protein